MSKHKHEHSLEEFENLLEKIKQLLPSIFRRYGTGAVDLKDKTIADAVTNFIGSISFKTTLIDFIFFLRDWGFISIDDLKVLNSPLKQHAYNIIYEEMKNKYDRNEIKNAIEKAYQLGDNIDSLINRAINYLNEHGGK